MGTTAKLEGHPDRPRPAPWKRLRTPQGGLLRYSDKSRLPFGAARLSQRGPRLRSPVRHAIEMKPLTRLEPRAETRAMIAPGGEPSGCVSARRIKGTVGRSSARRSVTPSRTHAPPSTARRRDRPPPPYIAPGSRSTRRSPAWNGPFSPNQPGHREPSELRATRDQARTGGLQGYESPAVAPRVRLRRA